MPSREASYRNLILNQRVNQVSAFIARATWDACGGEPEDSAFEGPVYIGLDLSARNDLTALVMIARDQDKVWHVRAYFFAPEIGLLERAKRDRAPYDIWEREGLLTATPGASVAYEWVAHKLGELCEDHDVQVIAFDRWRIDVLRAELARIGLEELPLKEFGQGFRDMSPAIDSLESNLLNGAVRHGMNPILTWGAASAVVAKDPAGNRKLDKSKATGRIDGLVALTMAMGAADAAADADKIPDDYVPSVV